MGVIFEHGEMMEVKLYIIIWYRVVVEDGRDVWVDSGESTLPVADWGSRRAGFDYFRWGSSESHRGIRSCSDGDATIFFKDQSISFAAQIHQKANFYFFFIIGFVFKVIIFIHSQVLLHTSDPGRDSRRLPSFLGEICGEGYPILWSPCSSISWQP